MKRRPRIYYSDSQKALMWEHWKKGESLQQIAQLFDRNHSSVSRILAETGAYQASRRLDRVRTLGFASMVVAQCFGASVFAGDLLEVFRLAQQKDPTYQAGRYALEAVQEKLPQARANLLPQISASDGRSRSNGQYLFGIPPESERNINASNRTLQLVQPLIRAQYWETYSQAEYQIEQASAQFALVEQELVLRVAQAYFDVDVAKESLKVADAQVLAVKQQLDLNKKGFASGTNAITEVHEAQARFDLARSQRVAAKNDIDSKVAELEKIVGVLPPNLNCLKTDAASSLPEPNDIQVWVSQARENAPAVRVQRAAVQVAEKEIAKNRAGHLPTLDLTVSYGRNYSSNSSSTPLDYESRSRASQVGVQLNVPLYSGGMVSSKVREASAQMYQAKADLETAQRQAATSARQAYSGVENGLAQVEALTSAIESSRQAVKGNQMGLKLGTRISVDVLNAEQQLYTAQRDLIKVRYEILLQGLKLKAAAGMLSETDIFALNSLFGKNISAPSAH